MAPPDDPRPVAPAGAAGAPGPVGDVVTGEAVVLGLRVASFASRLLSAAIDAVVHVLLLGALVLASRSLLSSADEAATAAVLLTETVLCLVGVPTAVETATRGRSLGKLVVGVRAVRDDGGPVRFRHALVRALIGFFELYALVGSPAIICALVDARGKRVGDLLAGTHVVRERTAARHVPLPPMPPELAGWAAGADIGRLPDGTVLAARQFLARAASLHAGSRSALGTSLADALLVHVAPAPPAGTDPERFLAAVLVARRDRELVRLRRRAERTAELERSVTGR
ncbi:RDD family protein [Kineococcus gypseus]|uniref:RDD family protein n=1 Tax=Kineococcus gypseus TaxID=1637102 RepID=UPI003D7EB866